MTTEKMRVSASSVINRVADTSATAVRSRADASRSLVTRESVASERLTKFRTAFVILAVVWAFVVPAAAVAATRPASAVDTAFAFVVYRIGRLICHQRPERSFHLAGAQLPVCARCTGVYAGAALMAIVGWCLSRGPARRPAVFGHTSWAARRVLLIAVTPM